jgi:transcriptional regulator with XRE-family HTH domain
MNQEISRDVVASRLRSLREARGLSLRELASRAGVAVSFLSKIEAGKASPTIMSLVKILEALEVEVAAFFGGAQARGPADQVAFPRRQMRALREIDRTWWYAFPQRDDIKMVLTYEEYKPRSRVSEVESHKTDLCGYVIEGTLTLEIPGRETVTVPAGDAFYIKAHLPHIARNDEARSLKLVAVQLREA